MMKDLSPEKNNAELSMIIKSLIKFIVIDGKEHVKKEEQLQYIRKYVYTLTKSVNGHSSMVNMRKLNKQIEKDLKRLAIE